MMTWKNFIAPRKPEDGKPKTSRERFEEWFDRTLSESIEADREILEGLA